MKRLEGQVAIVTAATKGIGESIAVRLGEEGAKVFICSRKQQNVDDTLKKLHEMGIEAHGIACNVGDRKHREQLVEATLQKFGKISILVNNAGINPHFGDILEVTERIYDKLFDVNVKAGFLLSQAVVPHMEKAGGGSIVFNASIGAYRPPPGIAIYGVTKTTLLGLTKALAVSLAHRNIRVNCISPGLIRTDFSRALWDDGSAKPDLSASEAVGDIPMKRMGEPNECAGAVAFLCSNDASYITGESILIGGGIHARL